MRMDKEWTNLKDINTLTKHRTGVNNIITKATSMVIKTGGKNRTKETCTKLNIKLATHLKILRFFKLNLNFFKSFWTWFARPKDLGGCGPNLRLLLSKKSSIVWCHYDYFSASYRVRASTIPNYDSIDPKLWLRLDQAASDVIPPIANESEHVAFFYNWNLAARNMKMECFIFHCKTECAPGEPAPTINKCAVQVCESSSMCVQRIIILKIVRCWKYSETWCNQSSNASHESLYRQMIKK